MIKKNKEILVGFVTITGILILILAVIWGKNIQRNTKYKPLIFEFNTINSLAKGDQVYVRGVLAGKVSEIKLASDKVIVKAIIKKKIPIYNDASAVIVNKELMGGRMIVLDTGKSKLTHDTTKPVKGINNKGLTEALAEAVNMLGDFKRITLKIDTLVTGLNKTMPKKNLDETINTFTSEFNKDIKSIKRSVQQTLVKLDNTLESFDNASKTATVSLHELTKLSPVARNALINFDNLMIDAKRKLKLLNDTTNTFGKLLSSNKAYFELRKTLQNLDSLANHMREKGIKTKVDLF